MATPFPIPCPLRRGDNVYGLPGVTLAFSGGNNLSKNTATRFSSASTGTVYGSRRIPPTIDTSAAAKFRIIVCPDQNGAATNKVRLEMAYRVIATGGSRDFNSWQEQVNNLVDVAAWVSKNTYEVFADVTPANLTAGALIEYWLKRNKVPGDDTFAGNVWCLNLDLYASI